MHPASHMTDNSTPATSEATLSMCDRATQPTMSQANRPLHARILVSLPGFVSGLPILACAMLAFATPAAAQTPTSAGHLDTPSAAVPPTSIWPKKEFKLPVEIAPEGTPPRELQLFVARPTVGSWGPERSSIGQPNPDWKLVGRKPFPTDYFDFVSPQDGTYWFAIRTLDSSGLSSPASLRPDVAIFVDTKEPQIQINAESDEVGTVSGQVVIQDSTDIRQFQLQYHADDASTWTVLPPESVRIVERRDGQPDRRTFEFQPPGDWRRLTLRASAADSANHVSHLNQLIERPRLAAALPRRLAATNRQVPARVASGPVQNPLPITRNMMAVPPPGYTGLVAAQQTTTPAFTPNREIIPTPPAVAVPDELRPSPGFGQAPSNLSTFGNPTDLNAPVNDGLIPSTGPPVTDPETSSGDRSGAIRWNTKAFPEESKWDPSHVMNGPRRVEDALRPLTPRDEPVAPKQSRDGQLKDDAERYRASRLASDLASQNVPIRHSDSPRFSLEYELEAVGSSGANAIELWGSTDGGTTWEKWGEDPDRASPFDIETKGDGVFGFRIVVLGGNGLNSPAPRSGEPADINVVVDQQAPKTRITGARYGEGDAIGCLVIRYECIDDFLATRPVTLAFSPRPDGPWTTIAGGLRNDGQYIWPADPGLPPQMYLRITAADKAGNVGSFQLDQPIDTQGLAPRARIRGFQILSDRGPSAAPGDQTAERPRATFK